MRPRLQTGNDLDNSTTPAVNAYGADLVQRLEKSLLGANPVHGVFLDA